MTDSNPKIFVAGHRGMVGSAIVRRLETLGHDNIVTRTRRELDLLDQQAVMNFMQEELVDQVYLAAAKVGGGSMPKTPIRRSLSMKTWRCRPTWCMGPTKAVSGNCFFWEAAASTPGRCPSP